MKRKWTARALLEMALFTAVVTAMALLGLYIPQLIIFAIILSAVSLVILVIRTDVKVGLLTTFATYALLMLATRQVMTTTAAVMSLAMTGLALGYGLKRKWQFRDLLLLSAAAYLVSILGIILLFNYVEGVNQINRFIIEPAKIFLEEVETNLQVMIDELKRYPFYAENVTELENRFIAEDYLYVLKIMIPSIFIISSVILGYVTLVISKKILNRMGYSFQYLPDFSQLRVTKGTALAYVVSFGLLLFVSHLTVRSALVNIIYIFSVILMTCGAATFVFFVKKAGIPFIVRVVIYLAVTLTSVLLMLVMPILHPSGALIILAIADSLFDFRKLKHKGD